MTKPVRWGLIGVIVLIIIGLIIYPRIKHQIDSNEKTSPMPGARMQRGVQAININATVMKRQTLADIFIRAGKTIPDEDVNLSFESSGLIVGIFFTEGTHVKKGDLLAKINDKPLQAELKKLEAQVPLAEGRVYRQKTLLESEAVSQEAFEQVSTDYDRLMADIELVKARIQQTELRAPFDGIIGLRQVSEGAYATSNTVIVNLTRISPLKIEFSVPERYALDITNGTNITFYMEDITQMMNKYNAKVYAVESKMSSETLTLNVRALYPNTDESILPGRYVRVEIITKEIPEAITVPNEAIIPEMGKNIVYLFKNGAAMPVEIKTGIRTESHTHAIEGLHPGDTVITSGIMQMRTGMKVSIDNLTQ